MSDTLKAYKVHCDDDDHGASIKFARRSGVQSTTLYLMMMDGELETPVTLNAAVFSDVGEEPDAVYKHLEWLKSQGGPPIVTVSAGKLGDDLMAGKTHASAAAPNKIHPHYQHRNASIPAYTAVEAGKPLGIVQRQCTKEYKIEPIERWIRRELIGLKHGERFPKGVTVHQYMGFSRDEPARAARARLRFAQLRWGEVHFPLFEEEMTRLDCVNYLKARVPHEVPRSACVFCPFKSNREWRNLKQNDPEGWARAVEVDRALRDDGNMNRKFNQKLYVHRNCVPLEESSLDQDQGELFDMECEGGCGL